MLDATCLFEKNVSKKRKTRDIKPDRNGRIVLSFRNNRFTSVELRDLSSDINYILKVYKNYVKEIVIFVRYFAPKDKLVYILLESVLYTLIHKYKINAVLEREKWAYNINTGGLENALITKLATRQMDYNRFVESFHFFIDKNHFRRVMLKEKVTDESTSNLVTEIKTFLFRFHMDRTFDSELALMIGELADNVYEHAEADCLIDIDITDNMNIYKDSEKKYYAINIVVLNFSSKCLHTDIRDKILKVYYKNSARYDAVKEAYENHKLQYGKNYNEMDFFNVASFQDDISGRKDETETGGTGLGQMVRNIVESAHEDYCYVLTGNSGIWFRKECLKYTDDGWIGFNKSGNFISEIPDEESIIKSNTYLPGIGYNFMLCFGGKSDEQ